MADRKKRLEELRGKKLELQKMVQSSEPSAATASTALPKNDPARELTSSKRSDTSSSTTA